MTFGSFFEVYEADKKQRVKESTWESKSHVIRTKILPYFENRKIAEIEAKDVIAWQNELMAYKDEKGKEKVSNIVQMEKQRELLLKEQKRAERRKQNREAR